MSSVITKSQEQKHEKVHRNLIGLSNRTLIATGWMRQLYTTSFAVRFDMAGDLAAAADYDGDLKTDIAVIPSINRHLICPSKLRCQVQMAYSFSAGFIDDPRRFTSR